MATNMRWEGSGGKCWHRDGDEGGWGGGARFGKPSVAAEQRWSPIPLSIARRAPSWTFTPWA